MNFHLESQTEVRLRCPTIVAKELRNLTPPTGQIIYIYFYFFTIKSLTYISIYALANASEPSVTLHANMLTLTV